MMEKDRASNFTRWIGNELPGQSWLAVLALAFIFVPLTAWAGTIAFSLSLTDSTLTAKSVGDSSAFFPTVLRLRPNGHWEALPVSPGTTLPAELVPGAHFDLSWTQTPNSSQSPSPLETLQPLMVRFFDQTGVSFGQISFLQSPSKATDILPAYYKNGKLNIIPPWDAGIEHLIRASWLLWAQEEGITAIRSPLRFETQQPSARYIKWRKGMRPICIDTGAHQPLAILLHDTGQEYRIQVVSPSRLESREQRSVWLDASPVLYRLALLILLTASLSLLLFSIAGRKGKKQEA